ncbi:CRISPR system precrRNA processing endoribonuclease RAMP protein Cas6 [Litorilinea aerophila]|uniref:CRISPR system precrRNA processing endoribonuclease RAMP protein Cas6 n=1 Tax=Litorilinea aerophila TaxID=1204385 RepID=A0A540VD20_9CHLR|nr:CRISPR system precrRNA processing endoribonuclease RAMP protein Cas6 [Litorilinea aerophila]MCC9077510.1 CRISPR system precrRNA processing endoribonuclease RAMP protein Cas6 [Litorilinea aerophila]
MTATSIGPAIPLTVHRLRFTVRAETPIVFNEFKGSALRGAFATTLRRHFCPEWRAEGTDPLHRSLCPVCQILSLEQDDSPSGDVRRPYVIEPPLDATTRYAPGERFHFTLLLLGDNLLYLPYLVLAVKAMGEQGGVGRRLADGQRGRFTIEAIDAVNPFSGEEQSLLRPGRQVVDPPTVFITHDHVLDAAARLLDELAACDNHLSVEFLTPLRLIQNRQTVEAPHFFPLIKQSVLRVLDVCAQYGGGRPDIQLKREIYPHADQVALVMDQTRWWDLKGYSGRLKRPQVLGGLVGRAIYRTTDWQPLLPWLLWSSVIHVGKNVVKGCGALRLWAGRDEAVRAGGMVDLFSEVSRKG